MAKIVSSSDPIIGRMCSVGRNFWAGDGIVGDRIELFVRDAVALARVEPRNYRIPIPPALVKDLAAALKLRCRFTTGLQTRDRESVGRP